MPIGSRGDQTTHTQGYSSVPATLRGVGDLGGPAPDPGQTTSTTGGGCGCDSPLIRRFFLGSTMTYWPRIGADIPMAHLPGPTTGSYVIERIVLEMSTATGVRVLVGQPGDYDPVHLVDMVDNTALTALVAIGSDPQPIRVLAGEELTIIWDSTQPEYCTASMQARVLS